jgi:hypothetical protein
MIDHYSNLILLCKVDHKQVDDQPNAHSVEKLRTAKADHERWVEKTLEVRIPTGAAAGGHRLVRIERIQTGKELLDVVDSGLAFCIDHPEPKDEEEAEMIAELAGLVQDWSDISGYMEAAERVRTAFRSTTLIRNIEAHGLTVWGGSYFGQIVGGSRPFSGAICVVVVRRS